MGLRLGYYFIPFPQDIVDRGLRLTLGEYRLLGYLLRHQVRLGKAGGEPLRLKQDDLIHGRLLPDGKRIDQGCGLKSGRDLKTARDALCSRGWLEVTDTPEGMVYTLITEDGDSVVKVQDALFQKCTMSSAKVHNALDKEIGSRRSVEENLSPSSKEERKPDPRYPAFVDCFHRFYKYLTEEDHAWGKSHGQQLNNFLADNPEMSVVEFRRWLFHYGNSKNINRAAKAREVLPRLHLYRFGPLNEFGKPAQPQLAVVPAAASPLDRHRQAIEEDKQRSLAKYGSEQPPSAGSGGD